MSASKIQRTSGLKPWDKENMLQAFKTVCNKEMGYLAAAKNIIASFCIMQLRLLKLGPFLRHPVKIGA